MPTYSLAELIEKMEPQGRRDKALIRECITGLTVYAAQHRFHRVSARYPVLRGDRLYLSAGQLPRRGCHGAMAGLILCGFAYVPPFFFLRYMPIVCSAGVSISGSTMVMACSCTWGRLMKP